MRCGRAGGGRGQWVRGGGGKVLGVWPGRGVPGRGGGGGEVQHFDSGLAQRVKSPVNAGELPVGRGGIQGTEVLGVGYAVVRGESDNAEVLPGEARAEGEPSVEFEAAHMTGAVWGMEEEGVPQMGFAKGCNRSIPNESLL